MKTVRLLASLALVLLVACQSEQTPRATRAPEATEPSGSTPEASPNWSTCTHPDDGYTVSYPADWQTNDGEVMPTCSLFDPEPIEVQPASEVPGDIGVIINVDEVAFEEAADGDEYERILDRREETIAGRRAVRIESEATGEGLYDRGTLSTRWAIELDGRVLFALSTNMGQPPYATKQQVLDQMVATLRF